MKLSLRSLALLLLFSPAVAAQVSPPPAAEEPELVLVPFLPGEARVLRSVDVALLVYNPDASRAAVTLEALQVVAGENVIHEEALTGRLVGDPRYGEINALIERFPHELTELHRDRRYFAAEALPELAGEELLLRRREVAERWDELAHEYNAGVPAPFTQLDFSLPYDQLFFTDDAPGTRARLELRVRYSRPGGARGTATVTKTITRLSAPLSLPGTLLASAGALTLHAGDLHVHSCHGEAANACAPSTNCAAESLQTSGSFSYAQLRTQYELLGMDWFTATDHSYCINSTSEYQAIAAECAAVTDATFLCMPDIELSSDEEGPQVGSDLGDLICLGTTSANHLGAHQINQRLEGGDDGFLGFCNGLFGGDALEPFTDNIATIRAQGGYPIANHPADGTYGWNSHEHTHGIEEDGLQGVEIWNGPTQTGQGGNVGSWVDWLLDGRILYAYSGSDTHDDAFAFGANHVILGGQPFDIPHVHEALRAGRSFVSTGHVLVLEVGLGGLAVPMGSVHTLPTGTPATALAPRAHYNFGTDSGVISIFKGRVGDSAETLLCQSGPLTGQGVFECSDALETGMNSWYRAYSESGAMVAYTNPVFFLTDGDDPRSYCLSKPNSQGCEARVAFSGAASATAASGFEVSASEVINQQFGILFYGYAPRFFPFQDGTRCIAPPIVRTPIQNSGGSAAGMDCSGAYSLDFNAWIQTGIDPNLGAGVTVYAQHWYRDPGAASTTGLSDALQFTVGP